MPDEPVGKRPGNDFEIAFRQKLKDLGTDLPDDIWALVAWLESKGQHFRYSATQGSILSISMVPRKEDLWSHLGFDIPHDMVRYWIGKQGVERQIIPFVHCGGDGSYLGLWKSEGAADRFVFLGSEGEAFVVAESPKQFIALITMGYVGIEVREDLSKPPEQAWREMKTRPGPSRLSYRHGRGISWALSITEPARSCCPMGLKMIRLKVS